MAKRKSKKRSKGYLLPKYQEAIVPKNLKTIDSFYDNPAAMGSYLSYPYRTLQNPSYRDIRINPPQYHDPNTIRELHLEKRLRPTNITPEMMQTGGKVDLPKYQNEGDVKKYATEPIKETSFGDWWEDFEKSDVGKFVDAKGLRKEKDYFLGLLGYGDTAEEGRRFALDAAAMVNPAPDFINAADHAQQGKYTDAGLYAGFGLLPGAAGPIVNRVKPYLNKLKSFFKSSKIPKNFKSEIDWGKWNKEIPDNKELMEEYETIEALSKKEGTWMKTPSGKPFPGTPEQFVQQQSKNWRKAFGNTKATGAFPEAYKNRPVGKFGGGEESPILIHQTNEIFDEFDLSKFGDTDYGFYGKGVYLSNPDFEMQKSAKRALEEIEMQTGIEITPELKAASHTTYGDINMPLYAKIDNPVPYRDHTTDKEKIGEIYGWIGSGKDFIEQRIKNKRAYLKKEFGSDYDLSKDEKLQALIKDFGHIENLEEIWKGYDGHIVPLDYRHTEFIAHPQNIKSAVGNDGMFDMTNPNIYKEYGGEISKYQDGDEVFQIPEDLMQQHKNELKLVESADGVLMKNPESTATGFYGQLFSEIKNLPEMKGITRDKFAKDTVLQNQIYDIRFQKGIPDANNVRNSTVKNLNDLYKEYSPQIKEKGYSPMDLAGIVNLLGRQGTREFFGDHVRDKKSLSKVFPDKYGKGKKQANHTPDEYVEKMRSIRPDNLQNYNYDTQTYTNNTSSSKGVFAPDYMPDYKPFPLQVPYDFMNPDTLSKEGVMDMQKALLDEGYYLGTSGDNKDGVDGGYGTRTRTAYEDYINNLGIEIDEEGNVGIIQKAQEVLSETASDIYDFFMNSDEEVQPTRLPRIITNKGDTLRGKAFDDYIGKPGAYERALEKATKKEHGAEVDSVISMLEDMHGKHYNFPKYQDEGPVKSTTVDLGSVTYDTFEDAATPNMMAAMATVPVTSKGFNKVKGDKVILPGKGEEIPVTTEQMTEPIKVTGSDGKSKILEPGVVEEFKTPVLEEKLSPLDAFLKAKEEYGGLKTIKPSDKKSTPKSKNTSRKPVKMDSFGNVY